MHRRGFRFPLALLVVLLGFVSAGFAAPEPTIALAATQKTPTNVEPVRFSIVFNQHVTGFAPEDVIPSLGAVVGLAEVAPFDGTAFQAAVASIPDDGVVWISIPAGAAAGDDGAPSLPGGSDAVYVVLDRVPPSPPELSQPADGAATSVASPKLSWSASTDPSGVKNYRVVVEGQITRDTYTTKTSYSPSLPEGIYSWKVNCRDQAGNTSSWTSARTLLVDRSAPEPVFVSSSTHSDGVWTRQGDVDIAVTGGGDLLSGRTGYVVEWNQIAAGSPSGAPNRAADWTGETFAVPRDGAWWCHVTAVDRAGNRSTALAGGPFLIDREPPSLTGLGGTLSLPNDAGCLWATADWSCVVVTDSFDPDPSISFSVPAGSRLPVGRSDVIVTLCDHMGNSQTTRVTVVVYNTEPPVVTILYPRDSEHIPLTASPVPEWSVTSLAPIASVRMDGVISDCLDTRAPGRHQFCVSVVDTTGLETTACVPFVVEYTQRDITLLRVLPDGREEPLLTSPNTSGSLPALRLSEWLRVRCRVDEPCDLLSRAVVSFSLTRPDPVAQVFALERVGILVDRGTVYSLDLPLAVFRPGFYTLWLGFVDETNVGFSFELVR